MVPLAYYYVRWHYSTAVTDLTGIIRNFLWFFYEFFSIPLLLSTLFVPFHRLAEKRTKKFDPSAWAEAFIVTTLMRLTGAALRIFLITIGVLCIIATVVCGGAVLIVWFLAPLFLAFLVLSGLTLIAVG